MNKWIHPPVALCALALFASEATASSTAPQESTWTCDSDADRNDGGVSQLAAAQAQLNAARPQAATEAAQQAYTCADGLDTAEEIQVQIAALDVQTTIAAAGDDMAALSAIGSRLDEVRRKIDATGASKENTAHRPRLEAVQARVDAARQRANARQPEPEANAVVLAPQPEPQSDPTAEARDPIRSDEAPKSTEAPWIRRPGIQLIVAGSALSAASLGAFGYFGYAYAKGRSNRDQLDDRGADIDSSAQQVLQSRIESANTGQAVGAAVGGVLLVTGVSLAVVGVIKARNNRAAMSLVPTAGRTSGLWLIRRF